LADERVSGGIVCDLSTAADISFDTAPKLITFFGMLPNFEPNAIIARIAGFLGRADYLLCSANLAPGTDYAKGVKKVLPQYDNALTNDWLMTFLADLGVRSGAGTMQWGIEPSSGLLRITAHFRFAEPTEIVYANHQFKFGAGESIRLFYSYRYTPYLLEKMFGAQGIHIKNQWITRSGEEGVFLCQKA
jgi:hypothetical protein